MSDERVLPVDGVELCVQTFGAPGDPAVVLVNGMSSSMDWWEDGFCQRLAAGGRLVVRYDQRDTGRSTTYPPGEPGYTFADLRADTIALLDVLGISPVHLAGMSMGGAIVQCLAVEHPHRVGALTLIATSAALPGVPGALPGPEPALAADLADAGDRADLVDRFVALQPVYLRGGFEESRVRGLVRRVLDRGRDVAAAVNHELLEPGPGPRGALADIGVPTLVVHGTADPLFPPAHWDRVVAAMLAVDQRPGGAD